MNTYENKIEKLLRQLGVNRTYVGFKYTSYGVKLVIENPSLLTQISKGLYIDISLKYNTNIFCVERNIRTIKQKIWKNSDTDLLELIFNDIKEIPSNAVFLDCLAEYILENSKINIDL